MYGKLSIEKQCPNDFAKSRLVGQKPPLKPKEVWSIRVRLQISGNIRDLALFNLAIDSKLRSCDLVALRVSDVYVAGRVKQRTLIVQRKTGRPVQFELTEHTREAVHAWISGHARRDSGYLFPSRVHDCPHLSTRQYARIVKQWVAGIGLNPRQYGTHSLRRTKAALIYKKTGNLRAVQLLLGHTKIDYVFHWIMSSNVGCYSRRAWYCWASGRHSPVITRHSLIALQAVEKVK